MNRRFRPALEFLEDRTVPAVYKVTGTGDDGGLTPTAGTGTPGDPFLIASLRSAIQQANNMAGEDTIDLTGLTGANIKLNTALPTITGDLTINGSGKTNLTVQRSDAVGTPKFRIFAIAASAEVNINGLQITNGFADGVGVAGMGGGILNQGTLNLYEVNVLRNEAADVGGGIRNEGTLTVENSLILLNKSDFFGGGISNTGSAWIQFQVEISGNWARGGAGGIANQGSMTIYDTVIKGNFSNLGPGIGNQGNLTMQGGELNNNWPNAQNQMSSKGGGIYNFAGTATFDNVSIQGNKAGKGGGFYAAAGTVVLNGCTLGHAEDAELKNTATLLGPGGSWVPGVGHYEINGLNNIHDAREADGPPQMMNMLPNNGPVNGGRLVTITGEGLGDATAVTFGGIPASFTIISDTEILALSPAHSAGPVDVIVTNPIGDSELSQDSTFTYTESSGTTTTTTLSSSANPANYGQQVTFWASVMGSGGTPSGTVTFLKGATILGTATLSGGMASFATSTLSVGEHAITAVYSGDLTFLGSTSAVLMQTVNTPTTTTYLSSSANSANYGQQVTFWANVMPSGAFGLPTGSVSFYDGEILLGSVALTGGMASFATSTLSVGDHAITAVFSGDDVFPGSSSSVLTQTITPAFSSTMLMSSQNPAPAGTPVTFTATVYGMGVTPSGTVEFWEVDPLSGANLILLGTVTLDPYGVAVLSLSFQDTGTHRIKAVYLGNDVFNGSFATLDQSIT